MQDILGGKEFCEVWVQTIVPLVLYEALKTKRGNTVRADKQCQRELNERMRG